MSEHWDAVHAGRSAEEQSWFQREPATSLRLVRRVAAPPASVVDVGAGESTLADQLVADGFDVTVLDVSGTALAAVRSRLGDRAAYVQADVTAWEPGRTFDVWHDRAVFHFLVDPDDRARYVATAAAAVTGHLVLATFAMDGPTQCSGLPVCRYSPAGLAAELPGFTMVHAEREVHTTPGGAVQPFSWVVLARA